MYAKKNKKKVKKLRFSPVTVMISVISIKKTFFQPRIPKEPIVCVINFCHQLFFSSNTSDKLYYFCLPLNYLPISASKPT